MRRWLLATLGLLASLHGGGARAADTMHWLLIDFPPYSMPEAASGRPGDGAVDRLLEQVVAAWPDAAKHAFTVANTRRVWRSIEAGEPACHTGALHRPERERQAYLSDVFMPSSGAG